MYNVGVIRKEIIFFFFHCVIVREMKKFCYTGEENTFVRNCKNNILL